LPGVIDRQNQGGVDGLGIGAGVSIPPD